MTAPEMELQTPKSCCSETAVYARSADKTIWYAVEIFGLGGLSFHGIASSRLNSSNAPESLSSRGVLAELSWA